MALLAAIVDTSALLKVAAGSLVAGVGCTFAFALAILGATRSAESRREQRLLEAGAFAALASVALAACAAAIAIGIVVMTSR